MSLKVRGWFLFVISIISLEKSSLIFFLTLLLAGTSQKNIFIFVKVLHTLISELRLTATNWFLAIYTNHSVEKRSVYTSFPVDTGNFSFRSKTKGLPKAKSVS